MKIIVTTYPFTETDPYLNSYETVYNQKRRKLTRPELKELLIEHNPDIIIAGTEMYNAEVLDLCPNLKLISRVGIGVDSVDIKECNNRGIHVANTPDAPTRAVAEMTVAQILMMLRKLHVVGQNTKGGQWDRFIGRELGTMSVGIVGYGRIGRMVAGMLDNMCGSILVTDIDDDAMELAALEGFQRSSLDEIMKTCDVVSIHVPGDNNMDLIGARELSMTKRDLVLVNNSRGGIVNENALFDWLETNRDASCALDVFTEEPYSGRLLDLPNLFATPHLGSCTVTSRTAMERESIANVKKLFGK